jgi:Pyruvate/2-oxoacid:ferredoxin oxidoreductase delta subunit
LFSSFFFSGAQNKIRTLCSFLNVRGAGVMVIYRHNTQRQRGNKPAARGWSTAQNNRDHTSEIRCRRCGRWCRGNTRQSRRHGPQDTRARERGKCPTPNNTRSADPNERNLIICVVLLRRRQQQPWYGVECANMSSVGVFWFMFMHK